MSAVFNQAASKLWPSTSKGDKYLGAIGAQASGEKSAEKLMRDAIKSATDSFLPDSTEPALAQSFAQVSRVQPDNKTMTNVTREELFAKMDSQSSKLDARLAEMRADMAVSRREQSEQIGRVAESVAELRGSVVGLGGRLDGLVTSMTMLQWCIGAVGLAGGIWIAYQQLKLAEAPPVASVAAAAPFQMPPIIINVPASVAPPAVAPAPK